MADEYVPKEDHSRDWLKVGGLGCLYYGGFALAILVLVALVVVVLRWIF